MNFNFKLKKRMIEQVREWVKLAHLNKGVQCHTLIRNHFFILLLIWLERTFWDVQHCWWRLWCLGMVMIDKIYCTFDLLHSELIDEVIIWPLIIIWNPLNRKQYWCITISPTLGGSEAAKEVNMTILEYLAQFWSYFMVSWYVW